MAQSILDNMTHIVKRHGHKQHFDERKIYASVFAACKSSHVSDEEAESIANLVAREVKNWIEGRDEVTSAEVFKQAGEELEHLNKEAAFMYTTHRDIS